MEVRPTTRSSGFRANSPVQPFVVARDLYSAMENVATYEAKMNLDFRKRLRRAQERIEAMQRLYKNRY